MYLLQIKGRGFFNGFHVNNKRDWQKNRADQYNQYTDYKAVCKFKRNHGEVDSSNSFIEKQDAETFLANLKETMEGWMKNGSAWDEKDKEGWNYGRDSTGHYTRIPYKYTEHYTINDEFIRRAHEKIEIVEVNDYIEPKKTHRPDLKREVKVEDYAPSAVCDCCRTNFVSNEPYMILQGTYNSVVYICYNCLDQRMEELKKRYLAHPRHEEISTSWLMENMSNEL